MTTPIDFQPYVRPPRIDAPGGIALAHRIIRTGYPGENRATIRALAKVRSTGVAVQEEMKKRGRTARANLKPLDAVFDNGWSALRDRVSAWTLVADPTEEKNRVRAEQLLAVYFPEGVGFVQLAYEAEWVHSQQLLERFDDENAVADIERLAGAAFLANVRLQNARLGEALDLSGSTPAEKAASTTGLAEKINALSAAIADYTRRYAGEVDADNPASVAAFLDAMQPLDKHRASAGAGGKETAKDDAEEDDPIDPAAPLPNLPPPFTDGA